MSPANERLVFISYSSKDGAFIRKLDASLSGQGVAVFLDDRDIKVGDSIPTKIYEGITRATHVIYVISSNSKKSAWVQEELDIAKIKQKEATGCSILPVLIEDTEIPTSVKHIRYANFINWQEPTYFLTAFNRLLTALDVELSVPQNSELRFYLTNLQFYSEAESALLEFAGFVDGAMDADHAICNPNPNITNKTKGVRIAVKWKLEDDKLYAVIDRFVKAIRSYELLAISLMLPKIIEESENFLELLGKNRYRGEHWVQYAYPTELRNLSARISGMLQELRLNVTSMIAGGFKV